MSLAGKTFAISGKLSQKRDDVISVIKDNGGTFSASVNKKVTHLIVGDTNAITEKIKRAKQQGKIVVNEAWLTNEIAEDEKKEAEDEEREEESDDDAKKTKVAKKKTATHRQTTLSVAGGEKVLSGMVIAITGRLSKTKEEYSELIAQNGGTFSNTVTKKVTHVVAKDPDAATTKLEKARKYGAKVVGEEVLLKLKPQEAPAQQPSRKELEEGESITVQSSSSDAEYTIKKSGGVTHCNCPGWRNQSLPVDKRTCKHLKELFGKQTESTTATTTADKRSAPPKLLLAQKYEEKKCNPKGWWVSEKLDGVRAYWDGKTFWSRLGNRFYAPEWFCEALPTDCTLDGELWLGRERFDETISVVRSQDYSDRWHEITFMVFDIPSSDKQPFEQRMQTLRDVLGAHDEPKIANVRVVRQRQLGEDDNLDVWLKEVEDVGGEGLMLREPRSKYTGTRSKTLLKVKSFHDDEAKVIGYATEGKGRLKGTTGSLLVQDRQGIKFKVGAGLTDEIRRNPPKVGSIITYRYQEKNKNSGKPRFPTYVGPAIDKDFP
jgi:DNA ligase-1